jgi:hypothetical protein
VKLGFDRAQLIEGHRRELMASRTSSLPTAIHSITEVWLRNSDSRSTTSIPPEPDYSSITSRSEVFTVAGEDNKRGELQGF